MIKDESIARHYTERFGGEPEIIARAPGRINLIGEHTDYNGGLVLPAAISREMKIAASLSPDATTRLYSVNYSERLEQDLGDKIPVPEQKSWASYYLAVADQFARRGIKVPAIHAAIDGDVPLGAGLSSSAAFEVCVATLLNHLSGAGFSPRELALLAQAAEHSPFVGVRCGIMDQFASALGARDHALLLDCHTLEYETVPFDSQRSVIVIINSNKPRELRSSDYNRRREECEAGLKELNRMEGAEYETLRHVPIEVFERHEFGLDPVVARRVRHNVTENVRVMAFVEALRQNDLVAAGKLLYQGHASLRDDFEVSCRELDVIVDIASQCEGVYGARMTGAGFGGCAVALVHPAMVSDFVSRLEVEYLGATELEATVYTSKPANGASVQPAAEGVSR